MRGRNTRTDNPPRVSFFILIVKSEIKIFVWSVVKIRISISSVGATTGRPSSVRSQNAPSSVAKTKNIYLAGRGRRPRRPKSIRIIALHPSVIFFDCRDRRPDCPKTKDQYIFSVRYLYFDNRRIYNL